MNAENWQIEDDNVAVVVRSDSNAGRVEMWTSRRLPFEPKGVLLQARNHLRSRIGDLIANSQQMLEARYISLATDFVDTENVLLYNVGPSAFSSASRFGLRFLRQFSSPPTAPDNHSNWGHYHLYELVPRRNSVVGEGAIHFSFELPQLSQLLKPHDYWWAAKRSLIRIAQYRDRLNGSFDVSIEIAGPSFSGNYATLVKPLFDGIISGLHYDPIIKDSDLVCEMLARELGVEIIQVSELLRNPAAAVLGSRRVVAPYRDFVKWNPADELCIVGELLPRHDATKTWKLDVSIKVHK